MAVFKPVTVAYGEKSIVAFSRVVIRVSNPLIAVVLSATVLNLVRSPTVVVRVSMLPCRVVWAVDSAVVVA